MKILMIEDEPAIGEPAAAVLKMNNMSVDLITDGREGFDLAMTMDYDLILLDVMLPGMDGLDILRELRRLNVKTPVLMLTAKDQIEDRIKGLDQGADDYLPKPYDYFELLARIRALLRRSGSLQEDNRLRYGDVELDPFALLAAGPKGQRKLSKMEAQLLGLLMRRKKMISPKELIIERLWDMETDADSSNVEYHVSKMRSKLSKITEKTSIKVARGVGYYLETGHD